MATTNTTSKDGKKNTTTTKTTTNKTSTTRDNLSTEQIETWAKTLKGNLSKFINEADKTEDILENMAKIVKSSTDTELNLALKDLRSLAENTHRQLGNFAQELSSQLSRYTKSLGIAQSTLSDKLKNQDQLRESANKIKKLTLSK